MRKTLTAQLLGLSAALILPALAAAQFPYSAWECDPVPKKCSPALIPGAGQTITWGDSPARPELGEVGPSFSDETVNSFEQAFAEIKKISGSFTRGIPEDATAEDTKKLREQAHKEALDALKSANIARSEYNRLAAFMNHDLDLRMRVIGDES